MTARGWASRPKPLTPWVPKWRSRVSRAKSDCQTQSSRGNRYPVRSRDSGSPWRRCRVSFGRKVRSRGAMSSGAPSAARNSPVETSRKATPARSRLAFPRPSRTTWTAASQLFSRASRTWSFRATPGVTISVTPRLTMVLVVLGSSSWSHTATRWPARTSLGR